MVTRNTVLGVAIAAILGAYSIWGAALDDALELSLDTGWQWALEDEGGKVGDFAPLDSASFTNLERLLPSGSGFVWLRIEFTLPEALRGRDLACYLGRVTMADRTWVNDYFIGGEGRFPPEYTSEWNRVRVYTLPERALRPDAENVLSMRIWVDHEGSIAGQPFIAAADNARGVAARETFWNETVNLLSAAIMLIMAAYHMMLYIRRKKERENLTFALLNVASSIYLCNFFLGDIPGYPWPGMSFLWFQKIVANGMPFLLAFLLASFVKEYLGKTERRIVLAARLACFIVPVVAVLSAGDYGTLRSMRLPTQLFLLPPLAYVLYLVGSSLRERRTEAVALLWGFSPVALTVIVDTVLHEGLKLYDVPYFSGLGWQLVVISLLFILAGRFARSRTEVEDLNVNLERKVADRTAELSRANDDLSHANLKLEKARFQAERDMKMATYVQESFYPREAVKIDGWELDFHFQPMSGVSGDLYDFYTSGDGLLGLGLFDVSGHGVASGLVAMLAKSIIHTQFRRGLDRSLASVMEDVNKRLVAEKGEIENYLTGALLRISGNRVEYVNAGHPSLLFRQGATGKVRAVVPPESRATEGGVLGLDGLGGTFVSLRFPMATGDALLLYSDCLSEGRDAMGEEFGQERIREAFAAAPATSAAALKASILASFTTFIGTADLTDDLTFVVLLRA